MEDEPSYDISITHAGHVVPLDDAALVRAARVTLRRYAVSRATLSIALVTDPRIRELNERFLGHAGATDVITFDLRDQPDQPIDAELVISAETAAREAAARGASSQAECALYVVHGTLHLLGHDDLEPDPAQLMHEEEDRILAELGLGRVYSIRE